MQKYLWFSLGSALLFLLFLTPLPAQLIPGDDDTTGPVGNTNDEDEGEEATEPGAEDFSPYPGAFGRVDDREPHAACDTCFTVPGLGEGYTVFERIGTGVDEILLPRRIPNPAPLGDDEIRERVDEDTGEDIWYVGTQAFIGPTDEEYWSEDAPLSTIALKRIQMKYLDTIMSIPVSMPLALAPLALPSR